MVRNYVNKRKKSWGEDDMEEAFFAMSQGMKISRAAKEYGIPKATLDRRRKRKAVGKPLITNKILSSSEEKELVSYVRNVRDQGCHMTRTDICKLAFEYAELTNKTHRFNKARRRAGVDWYHRMIKEHPTLDVKKPSDENLVEMVYVPEVWAEAHANVMNSKSLEQDKSNSNNNVSTECDMSNDCDRDNSINDDSTMNNQQDSEKACSSSQNSCSESSQAKETRGDEFPSQQTSDIPSYSIEKITEENPENIMEMLQAVDGEIFLPSNKLVNQDVQHVQQASNNKDDVPEKPKCAPNPRRGLKHKRVQTDSSSFFTLDKLKAHVKYTNMEQENKMLKECMIQMSQEHNTQKMRWEEDMNVLHDKITELVHGNQGLKLECKSDDEQDKMKEQEKGLDDGCK